MEENKDNLSVINIQDPNNYLWIETIYFGAKVERLIRDPSLDINELNEFKLRALECYTESCRQIRSRFSFEDLHQKFASKFSPKEAMSGDILTISEYNFLVISILGSWPWYCWHRVADFDRNIRNEK